MLVNAGVIVRDSIGDHPDPFPLQEPFVTCADCGLLGLRTASSGQLVECTEYLRAEGFQTLRADQRFEEAPVCSVLAYDLYDEYEAFLGVVMDEEKAGGIFDDDLDGEQAGITAVKRMIHLDRECDQFFAWLPGFSPQEHARLRLDGWVREREERRDQEMRLREDGRDARMNERENRRDRETRHRHIWELAVLGGAVVVATLIGSMIQAGWIEQPGIKGTSPTAVSSPPVTPPAVSTP